MNKETFLENIFRDCEEHISISQLMRELSKLELSDDKCEIFARFVIEPRDEPEIEFTIDRAKEIEKTKDSLDMALEIAYTFSSEEELINMIKETLVKVEKDISKIPEEELDIRKWEEYFKEMDLYQIEYDILISIGFEFSKDLTKLSVKVIISMIIGFV